MRSSARSTFRHYLGRHPVKLLVGSALVTTASLLAVVPPRFIGAIIDDVTAGAAFGSVVALALGIVLVSMGEFAVRGFGRYHVIDSSRRVEYEMRNDLLRHLQTMDTAYYQRQRIGDLMARLTNDLTAVRQMYGFGILMTLMTMTILVFSIVAMLGVSVKLTLISLLLIPVASGTFWAIGRKVHRKFERLQAQFGDLSTKAQENFSGIRVVKAYSAMSGFVPESFASSVLFPTFGKPAMHTVKSSFTLGNFLRTLRHSSRKTRSFSTCFTVDEMRP